MHFIHIIYTLINGSDGTPSCRYCLFAMKYIAQSSVFVRALWKAEHQMSSTTAEQQV